jgi:hypothetical protein
MEDTSFAGQGERDFHGAVSSVATQDSELFFRRISTAGTRARRRV